MRNRYHADAGVGYPHDHVQGVWTCMWCNRVNVFIWDEEGADFTTRITMLCEFCGGGTLMDRDRGSMPTRYQ